ncbi:MAG: fused DSP-PTPase phosphatase/NAD kinase-like protein [Anaerolineales bacterium]
METLNKPIENAYWVVEGHFLAGEHPLNGPEEKAHQRLQALLESGFEAFFDLTMPHERPSYRAELQELASLHRRPVEYYSFPIPDFGIPTHQEMNRLLDTLERVLQRGLRTYLHCWGGVGRTGMVVVCYLIRRGLSGDEALRELQRRWQSVPKSRLHPHSPETEAQRQFVLTFQS